MEHFKLIIIGAGASGIAAAAKLLECGFTNFRILEAENRIGGRIHSTNLCKIPIELGAEWIHGEKGNSVFELASKHDLADTDSSVDCSFLNSNFYDTNGTLINKDISLTLTKGYYEILESVGKNLSSDILKSSLGHYFDVEFEKLLSNVENKLNIDSELSKKFLKSFENWENSIDASHSWYETSLSGHREYWECDGNILTKWTNNNYTTIFNLLTKKIPSPEEELPVENRIYFNKEVIKIKWNYDCKPNLANVRVECADGTSYSADKVLITCSLGVLKERATKMFIPCLPSEKLNCIKNLGFGTVDKIFVKFSDRWWGDDCNGYVFLWSESERESDSSGWLSGVICFHPIDGTSPVLRGWVTAEAAQTMESVSHCELLEGLDHLFEKFLGPTLNVPPIENCICSKWFTNAHFRGSYSCRLMKSEECDAWAFQLAKTVCDKRGEPVLFFGGEATHDHFFSTVHGAIEAGWREAKKILIGSRDKYHEVIVVGAGVSGLSAGKTLLENGISDVIILEAQSEPGGRIRTLQVGDYFLELGAQWIHGEKNEVFSICVENDLLTSKCSSEGEGHYYRENGEEISESLVREIDDVVKEILESCESFVSSEERTFHSIGEELLEKFNEYLDGCEEDTEEIRGMKRELFGWHIRYHLIDNSCFDLNNLSAKAWGHFKFCGGKDYVNFKNGYASLIKTMINSLPEDTIRYETSVERIEWPKEINLNGEKESLLWNKKENIKVTTNNGDTFYSRFVVVTCSLGYLKKKHKTLFRPPLPMYLTEAIELLDFGVINKIFLIYEEPWWAPKTKGFQLVWSEGWPRGPGGQWGAYLTGFDVLFEGRGVLVGWVGGEGARMVEEVPEEEVGRQSTEILRRFTKNREIPSPKKVIRTKWWSNEYVRGAYSHITVNCDEAEINCSNLAQPVYSTVYCGADATKQPSILLAGESAHENHYSTVHGAYESGKSQALVLLQYIQSTK